MERDRVGPLVRGMAADDLSPRAPTARECFTPFYPLNGTTRLGGRRPGQATRLANECDTAVMLRRHPRERQHGRSSNSIQNNDHLSRGHGAILWRAVARAGHVTLRTAAEIGPDSVPDVWRTGVAKLPKRTAILRLTPRRTPRPSQRLTCRRLDRFDRP